MSTITDTSIDLTSDPNVTDPADMEAGDIEAVEQVSDPTTLTGELVQFPVEVLAPHPDNPRTSLGDLDEGSGFHQMRVAPRVLIRCGRPSGIARRRPGGCPLAASTQSVLYH